jgi:hypothetical protein
MAQSLLGGRNREPLSQHDANRVASIALTYEPNVSFRYEAGAASAFHVQTDPNTGEVYGEVVFGPDIYPGKNVVNANSMIGIEGAIAHELQHFHRWREKSVLTALELEQLDEALTSLQAIGRYRGRLSPDEVHRLVADAIQRIGIYIQTLEGA